MQRLTRHLARAGHGSPLTPLAAVTSVALMALLALGCTREPGSLPALAAPSDSAASASAPVAASALPTAIPAAAVTPAPLARGDGTPADAPAPPAAVAPPARPTELFDVVDVIDGDTIHIQRGGEKVKLRLLSVDTEEKITGRSVDPDKPETVFGQETALWAKEFFAALAQSGAPPRVGLLFPDGEEHNDIYGRLLCHLILPDGTDFNLELVRRGKSPYFNKYGNSRICHAAFVAAQDEARAKKLGIWDPRTNRSAKGTPDTRRDYEHLMPWWNCRAAAIDEFYRRAEAAPDQVVASDDAAGLERAARESERGTTVEVFGPVDRTFDEKDGSLTVLFRSPDRKQPFRVRIDRRDVARFDPVGVRERMEPFRQNYLSARGKLIHNEHGFEMHIAQAADLRLGGPEPDAR